MKPNPWMNLKFQKEKRICLSHATRAQIHRILSKPQKIGAQRLWRNTFTSNVRKTHPNAFIIEQPYITYSPDNRQYNGHWTQQFSVQTATVGPAALQGVQDRASMLISSMITQSKPVSGQDPQALQEMQWAFWLLPAAQRRGTLGPLHVVMNSKHAVWNVVDIVHLMKKLYFFGL